MTHKILEADALFKKYKSRRKYKIFCCSAHTNLMHDKAIKYTIEQLYNSCFRVTDKSDLLNVIGI